MTHSFPHAFAGMLAIAIVACAGARSQASVEEDAEAFYAAFEAEVRESVHELGPDGREQLLDIMPVAEVEGATVDVLEVIETRPSLRPMVRRIQRFLRNEPSNWVRPELATDRGDRRLWHILLDAINGVLGRAPGFGRTGPPRRRPSQPAYSVPSGLFFPRPRHPAGHTIQRGSSSPPANRAP